MTAGGNRKSVGDTVRPKTLSLPERLLPRTRDVSSASSQYRVERGKQSRNPDVDPNFKICDGRQPTVRLLTLHERDQGVQRVETGHENLTRRSRNQNGPAGYGYR
jgi:hypothetical protein